MPSTKEELYPSAIARAPSSDSTVFTAPVGRGSGCRHGHVTAAGSRSEVAALSEALASGGVGDRERVAAGRVRRPGGAHLSVEQVASRVQRLTGRQIELVDDRCRRAAVALCDHAADGV